MDGACARYLNYCYKFTNVPKALFLNGNSSINIKSGEALFTEKSKAIVKAIFGEGTKNEITLGNSSILTLRCGTNAIATLSDRRDKTEIEDLDYGLDFVNSLRPVQFKWKVRELNEVDKNCAKNDTVRAGFIAQELQESMPNGENNILDLVSEENPERLEIKQSNLIPMMVKAIQELQAKVSELENKLNN